MGPSGSTCSIGGTRQNSNGNGSSSNTTRKPARNRSLPDIIHCSLHCTCSVRLFFVSIPSHSNTAYGIGPAGVHRRCASLVPKRSRSSWSKSLGSARCCSRSSWERPISSPHPSSPGPTTRASRGFWTLATTETMARTMAWTTACTMRTTAKAPALLQASCTGCRRGPGTPWGPCWASRRRRKSPLRQYFTHGCRPRQTPTRRGIRDRSRTLAATHGRRRLCRRPTFTPSTTN
mmetsp:Transcript_18859/g.38906  ORF Transcript_18859/g.38906 Transcript_18859/m.38906 type:complete len:233 (-) Transcript_18859:2861-3559(-)